MEFPAVTICAPGWSETPLNAAFYNLFLEYLQEKKPFPDGIFSGFDIEYYLNNKVCLIDWPQLKEQKNS